MDVALTIVLIVLAVAGIWLLVELILTVRKARPVIDSASKAVEEARPVIASVEGAVNDIRPVIAHADEAIKKLQPALEQADPLIGQTTIAIEALTGDLKTLEGILEDISRISDKAGNATVAVSGAATGLASRAKTLLSRNKSEGRKAVPAAGETSRTEKTEPHDAHDGDDEPVQAQIVPNTVHSEKGYFTYPSQADASSEQKAAAH